MVKITNSSSFMDRAVRCSPTICLKNIKKFKTDSSLAVRRIEYDVPVVREFSYVFFYDCVVQGGNHRLYHTHQIKVSDGDHDEP